MTLESKLEKANRFVAENKDNVVTDYRHHYHVMAPIGWVNDPNGFVFYKGEYHLFFQHYPYDSSWGPMHWGHVKSKDLVHWEELPIALAPDQPYDKDGCFSGSAIEKDGKLYLMYTGHVVEENVVYQRQCIAVSEDGIHFEKSNQNPVIGETLLGENGSIHDFRDPKVFIHKETYYSVIATKTETNHGRILLFSSKDLIDWQFYSVMLEGDDQQGIMWECPDFFTLDGKDVLIMSPIQIPKRGYEFHNISSTIAFIGKMDWENGKFLVENDHEIDGGLDFYAPQTLEDDQGRRIMIAWMQMWDRTLPTHNLGHKWSGAMTLPRQLQVEKNCLVQKPVEFVYETITLDQEISEQVVADTKVIMTDIFNDNSYLSFKAVLKEASSFDMQLAKNDTSALMLSYQKEQQLLTLSRKNFGHAITGNEDPVLVSRSMIVPLIDQQLTFELFRDTSSLEVFVNETQSMTLTFYEAQKGQDVVFESQGATRLTHIKVGHLLV